MGKVTMKDRILKYIHDFGSITTREALLDLGCCDLQNYIRLLRRDYYVNDEWVHSNNRWGEKVKYKRYWIEYKYDREGV